MKVLFPRVLTGHTVCTLMAPIMSEIDAPCVFLFIVSKDARAGCLCCEKVAELTLARWQTALALVSIRKTSCRSAESAEMTETQHPSTLCKRRTCSTSSLVWRVFTRFAGVLMRTKLKPGSMRVPTSEVVYAITLFTCYSEILISQKVTFDHILHVHAYHFWVILQVSNLNTHF